jgi:hypothetical protein
MAHNAADSAKTGVAIKVRQGYFLASKSNTRTIESVQLVGVVHVGKPEYCSCCIRSGPSSQRQEDCLKN